MLQSSSLNSKLIYVFMALALKPMEKEMYVLNQFFD